MMIVTLRVEIDDTWNAGTRLQAYTDFGTGSVDLNTPLLRQPQAVFPGALPSRGYGLDPYGDGGYGTGLPGARRGGGYGEQPYGETPYGESQAYVEIAVTVPTAFGSWKFALEALDAAGNVQGDALTEIEQIVSGTEPPALKSFGSPSHDAETDTMTFTFTENVET